MEFYTRSSSSTFVMNICLIILAFGMAVLVFVDIKHYYGLFHYSYILWLLLAFVRLLNYSRYIRLIINKKPVLVVNENYIYDAAKDMKYYWKDIEELYDENAYLYIKFYDPAAARCKINMDMIKVNEDVLLEVLNDYSIQAHE